MEATTTFCSTINSKPSNDSNANRPRCILVMKMFVGDYLQESNNIGHEVINLFRADNGKHYIYVVPWGVMGKEKDGQITDILLVRYINGNGEKRLRILAKISGIEERQHIAKRNGKDDKEEVKLAVCNHAKDKDVRYSGKTFEDIFKRNTYKNEVDTLPVYFTFEVESEQFKVPNKIIDIKGTSSLLLI